MEASQRVSYVAHHAFPACSLSVFARRSSAGRHRINLLADGAPVSNLGTHSTRRIQEKNTAGSTVCNQREYWHFSREREKEKNQPWPWSMLSLDPGKIETFVAPLHFELPLIHEPHQTSHFTLNTSWRRCRSRMAGNRSVRSNFSQADGSCASGKAYLRFVRKLSFPEEFDISDQCR